MFDKKIFKKILLHKGRNQHIVANTYLHILNAHPDFLKNYNLSKKTKIWQSIKFVLVSLYRFFQSIFDYEDIFLKFEIVILPNGTCLIPEEKEVVESLDRIAHHFEDKRKKDLNFVQRVFDGGRGQGFKKSIYEIREGISNGQDDGSLAQ